MVRVDTWLVAAIFWTEEVQNAIRLGRKQSGVARQFEFAINSGINRHGDPLLRQNMYDFVENAPEAGEFIDGAFINSCRNFIYKVKVTIKLVRIYNVVT